MTSRSTIRAMPRYGLPWIMLVNPAQAWRALREGRPSPWPALVTQMLLLYAGWLAAHKPMAELAEVSGLGKGGLDVAALVIGTFAIVATLAILAIVLRAVLVVLGERTGFRPIFTWLTYGVTPLFIGRFLGLLSFAVFQPLAKDRADAIALQLNPLGLSLASAFAPLSLPWTIASALDIFALWSLVLLALGAVHFLRVNSARAAALLGALLLIWLLALTLVWQGLQRSL
jgi:Yip1 domain